MNNLFVFDTNSLISAALLAGSVNRKALDKAILSGELDVSDKTVEELTEVLFRQKFDTYFVDDSERWRIIDKIESHCKMVVPSVIVTECRDPKDNKFLELAITVNASCIITGDNNLLVLNPFRGIPIMNAAAFLNSF